MFRKKSLSDELFLLFFYKSVESGRFFIYLHDSNSIFWAQGIKSEWFLGRTVKRREKRERGRKERRRRERERERERERDVDVDVNVDVDVDVNVNVNRRAARNGRNEKQDNGKQITVAAAPFWGIICQLQLQSCLRGELIRYYSNRRVLSGI